MLPAHDSGGSATEAKGSEILARMAASPALRAFDTREGSPLWLIANAVAHEAAKLAADISRESLNCIPSTSTGEPLREGNGLTGMRERIAALGGTVGFSREGGGLRIEARLPLAGVGA